MKYRLQTKRSKGIETFIAANDLNETTTAGDFLNLAKAYIHSALHLLMAMKVNNFPDNFYTVQVSSFLFQHSVELFLKGAIFLASGALSTHHNLDQLYTQFKNYFPTDSFPFMGPISTVVKKDTNRPYSFYARYLVDKAQKRLWQNMSVHLEKRITVLQTFESDYCRLIPLIERQTMTPKIIALYGAANVGKSQTIKKVYDLLISKYDSEILESRIMEVDICVVIVIDGIKIGIESQGDPNSRLKSSLDHFANIGCKIIICATRMRGMTVDWVKSKYPPYEIVWKQKTISETSEGQTSTNFEMAKQIVAEVL